MPPGSEIIIASSEPAAPPVMGHGRLPKLGLVFVNRRYTRGNPSAAGLFTDPISSLFWGFPLLNQVKRFGYPLWIACLLAFAAMHGWHLRADFPNFSPWADWSKYTDEGWYGNAAIRAHLFGTWYVPGDFNPAPAVPLWPFLEWLLFFVTGVTVQAARGLAAGFFVLNLVLSYKLFRERSPRWVALLVVTLLVASPYLYCFSRLAILEPLLMTLTLTAMNLAIRLPRLRRQELVAAAIGTLFTLMMLTKTTAVFLLPALVWIIAVPYWRSKRRLLRLLVAAGGTAAVSFALWMLFIVSLGLFDDYKYLFFVNDYKKPHAIWDRVMSFWWSFHGGLWADPVLIPLAGILIVAAIVWAVTDWRLHWPDSWTTDLWSDPVFGGSVLAVGGYIGFMTYQNHPQPRYYVIVAFFSFFVVVRLTAQMLYEEGRVRWAGLAILIVVIGATLINAGRTLTYALHPQYTFVNAAQKLTNYIDQHPNGNRLLVSISGDDITLITHLPSLCDDFGTIDLPAKMARYQPGWYATWNDIDPGTIEDIHVHYSMEQVAEFPAFDDPDRNLLVLFKLHPLPGGQVRDPANGALQKILPDDKIDIAVE
jgi:hypothetical protein